MPIDRAVGPGCDNQRTDVRIVQRLLNGAETVDPPLVEDGLYGAKTWAGVTAVRARLAEDASVDAAEPLEPNGPELALLLDRIPPGPCRARLGCVMAATPAQTVARYQSGLARWMAADGIDTPLRQTHFLAQIGHESGGLRWTEEFASGAAYEGRADLGNSQPGDGPRFKGRGLIQLTGRANYTAFGRFVGLDLTADADAAHQVADDPVLAVRAATWFWREHGLNALADRDDVEAVTRRINGGLNGLDDRMAYLARARAVFLTGAPALA
jgi:putative chitinase